MMTEIQDMEWNSADVTSPLVTAKTRITAEIRRLEKMHKNTHGGYEFTSVDDFKDDIRPLMSKHGLDLHVSEESYDMIAVKSKDGKESNVAKIRFKFVLYHTSGDRSEPSYLTVCLPYTGAQTSGAAQSYAIKECVYKGLFQASSGDVTEEADLHDTTKFAANDRMSKSEGKPLYEALQREMRAIVTETRDHDELYKWWSGSKEQIRMLPLDWEMGLKKEYGDEWKLLKANADLDRGASS